NPVNRRIDIVVLTKKAQRSIEGAQEADPAAPADSAPATEGVPGEPVAPPAPIAEPLQAPQLREKLNIFEDGALQLDQVQTPQ
ncbi:MAG: motility protein MotB, partial [Pseudomonas sp.]|nr:motility protein MotB [Pseudomonas sp.]